MNCFWQSATIRKVKENDRTRVCTFRWSVMMSELLVFEVNRAFLDISTSVLNEVLAAQVSLYTIPFSVSRFSLVTLMIRVYIDYTFGSSSQLSFSNFLLNLLVCPEARLEL